MIEVLLFVWIIVSKEGTIIFVYCLGCKVRLVELCFYVVSVLLCRGMDKD